MIYKAAKTVVFICNSCCKESSIPISYYEQFPDILPEDWGTDCETKNINQVNSNNGCFHETKFSYVKHYCLDCYAIKDVLE
jgi:hypothetical protein